MTAQVSDSVIYQCQDFSITGINGSGLFDPIDYGIIPKMISTACRRGYYCTYEVTNGNLYLRCLNIGLTKEESLSAKQGKGPKLFDKAPEYSDTEHCFVYDELHEQIPFTGGILLGRDFIKEMYVHMGFHPAYKFKIVYEMIFDNGKVISESDRSAKMSQYREKISGQPLKPGDTSNREEVEK